MKILYLTTRLPIPPLVQGDTLRDFYIIKELASRGHKVTLVSFYKKNQIHDPNLEILKRYCHEIRLVKFDIRIQAIKLIKGIYSIKPFQVLLYDSKAFRAEINRLMDQEIFDVSYVHFARLAEYLLEYDISKILDLQDSFQINMKERYFREKNPFLKIIALIESIKMKRYEKRVSEDYSYLTVVSERDINPDCQNIVVVPNGIQDLKIIQKRNKQVNGLLFMGSMSYFANEDAALFLIKEVMPIISKEIPDLKLYIVGNNPGKRLKRYNSENIIITGFVPDMYSFLEKARIVVAPLKYATGLQNKILDAMVVGTPQIVSMKAAEGFSNLSGKEFIISKCEKHEFSEKIIKLWSELQRQDQLIENARDYALNNYSWEKSVSVLESLLLTAAEKQEYDISAEHTVSNRILI